jgi:uncharacterized membrane protein YecN with MAPEG domain
MTQFEAATLYIGLFVLLFVALKINSGRIRMKTRVNFGEGDNEDMIRAMRVQGNAVEDVPVTLLGLLGLAALAAPVLLIHILGGGFLIGRILHALGLGGAKGLGFGRMAGTFITLIVLLATAGCCVWFALA